MELFDKLSKAAKNAAAGASTLAKNAADSTEELIAVQKLKMKINEEERAIVDVKSFIGELVWQQFDGGADKSAEIEEQCRLIRESKDTIAELEQQIAQVKAEKESIRSERNADWRAAAAAAAADEPEAPTEAGEEAPVEAEEPAEDVPEEESGEDAPAEDVPAEEPAAEAIPLPMVEAEVVTEAAAPMDGYCASCGAQVSAGARFCGVCGAKQER